MKEAGFPLGVLLLFGVAYITGTVKAVCVIKWKFFLQSLDDFEHVSLNSCVYDLVKMGNYFHLTNPLSRLVKVENYSVQHIKLLFVYLLFGEA